MHNPKYRVLVVDDDRFAQKLIVKALLSTYELKTANDGDEAVTIALEWLPDAILLDVEMPNKNGYEVCEILKSNLASARIPIIFLSSNSSVREKMLGFELGAADYLVKPFEPELLNTKVKMAIDAHYEKSALDKKALSAQEAAFEALTISAELGRAMRFVEHTYAIPSFAELATSLFQSLSEFGLKTSVMFVTMNETLFFSHNADVIPPIEKDLLEVMHSQGRFSDFGCRTFCNFRQVSLLIKNMPLENRERYGRIKDLIPFMLGAVDGKIRSLDVQFSLMNQADNLGYSVDAISQTLTSLTDQVELGHTAITDVMKGLLADFDERLPKLGLEDDQEKYLVDRIDKAFRDALAEMDRSMMLGQSLAGVVRLLTHLQNQQRKMVETASVIPEKSQTDLPNDGNSLSGDVELF